MKTLKTTISSLSQNWLGLSKDYRPSGFWFWNADMDPDRIKQVIEEMAAKGVREFQIHPIHCLEVEYLSPEYFDRVRLAMNLARQHGLKVWIYDEYGWPSGNVGGKLLSEHPEYRGWRLAFSRGEDGKVIAEPRQSDRVLDCTSGAPWTQNEPGYLDTLSPEAVGCFIEMTHGRYFKECREFFDDGVIVGFFTDEPVTMMNSRDNMNHGFAVVGMPWTPSLPAKFKECFGYAIESRYAELAGDGPSSVKSDYWKLVKSMYPDTYYGQIGRWCREHGVKHSGHAGEDWLLGQVRYSGSLFQCLRTMDEPGIDYLGCGTDPEERFAHQVLVPSIARHAGRERVYCEAYGISPLDLRLGEMLKELQMFGLHGIDDVALMGFQTSSAGIRKQLFWPPVFDNAPWWEFYPEYRDASARSLSLTSLGKPHARYAILYPQNELEQYDLFQPDISLLDYQRTHMVYRLAAAIYEAGETFEYVFPEILEQAEVKDGKVVFPHAEYEAVLAPGDTPFFPESVEQLERICSAGGTVMRDSTDCVAASIRAAGPSWSDMMNLNSDADAGNIRVFRYDYPDGTLFVVRNVTSHAPRKVRLVSKLSLSKWDPTDGNITHCGSELTENVLPHGTLYITVADQSFGNESTRPLFDAVPMESRWNVDTERPNMARFTNVQFYHEEKGWLDPEETSVMGFSKCRYEMGIPRAFGGRTHIKMRGEFTRADLPDTLDVLFEKDHLSELKINGVEVDLSKATKRLVWDQSCRLVDIRPLAVEGKNVVEGTLKYDEFETRMFNGAFLMDRPMPRCDVCLAGSFRYVDGKAERRVDMTMPIDWSKDGWEQYHGILTLSGEVDVDPSIANRVRGVTVDLASEDCVEALIDGKSIGRKIMRPYAFQIEGIEAGAHKLQLRITSTSANILGEPSPWGIKSVGWLCDR